MRVVCDKLPGEAKVALASFASRLVPGDSLSTCTVTITDTSGADVTTAMVAATPTVGSDSVSAKIKAGQAGQTYLLTYHAVTTAGATLDELGEVTVRSASTPKTPVDLDLFKSRYLFGVSLVDPKTGQPYLDAAIEADFRTAEDFFERELQTYFRTTVIKCDPSPGDTYDREEPAYDYPPNFFEGERWGWVQLRKRPVQSVQRFRIAYPTPDNLIYTVPATWIKLDKKYGHVRLVPDRTAVYASFSAYVLQVFGGGRGVPHCIFIDYTAGFTPTELQTNHQDLLDLICKRAAINVLMTVSDALSKGITSYTNSADGLSQTITRVASATSLLYGPRIKEYGKQVLEGIEKWKDMEQGPRLMVLG
jgi:hypothetical protein